MNIAIIPARAGSRRIPGKNKRLFHGRPIICYSIECAITSELFQYIVVSTDDMDIVRIVDAYKDKSVQVYPRPPELCEDEVGTQEVARAVIVWMMETILLDRYRKQYQAFSDLACVIYPTAPLITSHDLRWGRSHLFEAMRHNFAFAVGSEPLRDAGAFYWGRLDVFVDRLPLVSPYSVMLPLPESRVCDINTEADWAKAEQMYAAFRREAA